MKTTIRDANPYLDVTLGGIRRSVSDIETLLRHSGRLEFPGDFPLEGLRRAQVDAEIISNTLRENPDEVRALLQAVVTGRDKEARRLVTELRLTEADFQERGGGIFWVVVIVGVLCCAGEAY